MAAEDVAAWYRYADLVVDLDKLRLDTKAELGQIRTLRQSEVDRLERELELNPPVARVRVTLWEQELDDNGDGASLAPRHGMLNRVVEKFTRLGAFRYENEEYTGACQRTRLGAFFGRAGSVFLIFTASLR